MHARLKVHVGDECTLSVGETRTQKGRAVKLSLVEWWNRDVSSHSCLRRCVGRTETITQGKKR